MSRAALLPARKRSGDEERLSLLRASVREGAENRPGVYQMSGEDGAVLYVGKSKRLRTRLLGYFRCDPEEKGARILRETSRITWEYCPSEFAALLAELRHIRRMRPRFNVAMKRDLGRYAFIKVTRGPAPKLHVARGPARDAGALYYGPFTGAGRVREAVRALSNALGLRDCAEDVPIRWSDQQALFSLGQRTPGCIRYEIKRCLGPCVAGCSSREYEGRVALARAFLEGRSDGPIARFREEMEAARARAEFERAAALRDRVQRLTALRAELDRLRFALGSLSFLYPVPGHEGDDRVYLIRRGRVRAEAPAPRSEDDRRALDRLAAEVFGPAEPAAAPVPPGDLDEVLLLTSWFQRFPEELARTLPAPGVKG
ncbi:GIY-YIG nuclease family protein [Sorangium sp. So ce131]|uniref:GIY-YIG nuclease family protein n=1 Tax=Sorangium sp. So ce131 TaxID=3133282 RepID=UPI003F62760F